MRVALAQALELDDLGFQPRSASSVVLCAMRNNQLESRRVESNGLQAAEGLHEGFLREILGLRAVAGHADDQLITGR